MVAGVGFLRRGEAGELAHGPELAAIHVAMNAARVGEFSRRGEVPGWGRLVERLHSDTTEGGEAAFRDPGFVHLSGILAAIGC